MVFSIPSIYYSLLPSTLHSSKLTAHTRTNTPRASPSLKPRSKTSHPSPPYHSQSETTCHAVECTECLVVMCYQSHCQRRSLPHRAGPVYCICGNRRDLAFDEKSGVEGVGLRETPDMGSPTSLVLRNGGFEVVSSSYMLAVDVDSSAFCPARRRRFNPSPGLRFQVRRVLLRLPV